MAKIIGIRVEPTAIHWTAVSGTADQPVLEGHGKLIAGRSDSEAQALVYLRQSFCNVLDSYTPATVAVRYQEPTAKGSGESSRRRARIEGVAMEAASARGIAVESRSNSSIAPALGVKSTKPILNQDEFRSLNWIKLSEHLREAILTAIATLKKQPQ